MDKGVRTVMPQLQLHLLGPFQLTRGEEHTVEFRSEKERLLLAYLAIEGARPHSREALAGLLWPEQPHEQAHNNLRVTLHRLRQALGDLEAADPLLDGSHGHDPVQPGRPDVDRCTRL